MYVLMLGEDCRYSFFRDYLDEREKYDFINNMELKKKTLYLSNRRNDRLENYYTSTKLPLNTTLVFPKEGSIDFQSLELPRYTKCIYFDEFPYLNENTIEAVQDIFTSYQFDTYEILVVRDKRKFLSTDLSNREEAIQEAIEEYENMGFSAKVFDLNENPDFLLKRSNSDGVSKKQLTIQLLEDVKDEIITYFDIDYKGYKEEFAKLFEDPFILDQPFVFNKSKNQQQLKKLVIENAIMQYFKDPESEFVALINDLYIEHFIEICFWDINNDLYHLLKSIKKSFINYFSDIPELTDYRSTMFYANWELENNNTRILIKNRIKDFFFDELKVVIKEEILYKINKLEELLYD